MVSGGLIAPEGAHDIIKEGQGEQKVLTVTEMEDVERMRQLEQGWNNKINIEKHSRRILTYGEDIRTFLNKSMTPKTGGGSPVGFGATTMPLTDSPEKEAARTQEMGEVGDSPYTDHETEMRSSSVFETIASTFNFKHHEGMNEEIELKMIKCIVTRESTLMKLKHFVDKVEVRNPYGEISLKPSAGTKILDLMIEIRSVTLDYLDNLHRWRLSDKNNDPTVNSDNPKVFIWEGYNYTMKIVSDLDFLSEKVALVAALGQEPQKMRANPLMLPGTLEETADTWIDPAMRASMDANNATSGELFEERLRLRNAERLLLLEIEVNSAFVLEDSMPSQDNSISDAAVQIGPDMMEQLVKDGKMSEEHLEKMLSWRQEAGEQLAYIDPKNANYLAAQEHLRPKNTDGSRGAKAESPEKDHTEVAKGEGGGRKPPTWNQQAEIFPEVDIDSGIAIYENFDRVEEKEIPPSELGKYDGFLVGSNVLESEEFVNSAATYSDQLGYNRVGSAEGTAGENFKAYSRRHKKSRDNRGLDLRQESTVSVSSSHATIDAVSQVDLEAMAKLARPPKSVILAGAICIILLSTEDDIPADVSWEAFCKLALLGSPVGAMNTLDPLNIPPFKTRAIHPFLERLTFARSNGDIGATQIPGGIGPGNSLVDAPGSINSLESYGVDMPLEALESIEKVFQWIWQVTTATTKGKKRRQQAKGKASHALPPLDGSGSGKPNVSGGGVKKAQLAAKRAGQSMAASRMMGGQTSTKRPKRTKKLTSVDSLWPVHTEILEHIYRHPLLLTVLSSRGTGSFSGSKAEMLKMKKMLLMVDPLNIAGNGMDLPPERIFVKLYNLVDSNEATVNLNIREFTLFLYELREKYGSEVSEYYRPASVLWWVENLRNVISVKARADKKLMVLVSKQAIERIVMQALGLYQSPKKDKRDGVVGPGSVASHGSSLEPPLGSLSMPSDLPVPDAFDDGLTRKQGHEGVPQQLELNEWDFYDADFEADPSAAQQQQSSNGTGTGASRDETNAEPKLNRQDMRANFDSTGNPLTAPRSGRRTGSGGPPKPSGRSKPQGGSRSGSGRAPSNTRSSSDSGSNDQQAEVQERQRAEMKALQEQQQIKNQQQHMLPEGLDYGEDVFEDDGEGEFEEAVARAQQISRSISREKPLSAPGSLSAPHSMSSLPSRHASEVDVVGRVDSNVDPQYAIDEIAEQSNENAESIISKIEDAERKAKSERVEQDDDIDSEMPLYGDVDDDIDMSTDILDSNPNSKAGSRSGSSKYRSGKNHHTDDVLDAVMSVEEDAENTVVSEGVGSSEQVASEVPEE